MPIDSYALCPCGSGKKLKFCCSDLRGEMEKISRMLEGDQRAACLAHLKALRKSQPERASLLGLEAMLEQQLGQLEEAQETIDFFLEKHPQNVIAWAEAALLDAASNRAPQAVLALQKALEGIGTQMPMRVYEAIGAVGQVLLMEGNLMAARAHLLLQASVSGEEDTRAASLMMRINASDEVPEMLKDDWQLKSPADDAPYKEEFETALSDAYAGRWRKSEATFATLMESHADAPAAWWNAALIRAWLGQLEESLAALHNFATLRVDNNEAIEAEALAQLLDPKAMGETVDRVLQVYHVDELDVAQAQLDADARVFHVPMDPAQLNNEHGPPPRSKFWLLDRSLPESGSELTEETVPEALAQVFLFGRETDRPPRLELVVERDEALDKSAALLQEIVESADGPHDEEVIGRTSRISRTLSWNWRFPEDTPDALREKLTAERREKVLLGIWPKTQLPVLGGKPPLEAAADTVGRIQTQAAILLMDMAVNREQERFDFNRLRAQLDLPTADPIDPTTLAGQFIPLIRLSRVQADKLADDELVGCYRRAIVMRAYRAIQNLTPEVIARPSLRDKVDLAEAYGLLADVTADSGEALKYVELARTAAEESGQSSAQWDLAEMAMQLDAGNADAANALLRHIQSEHIKEPGVAEQLFQLLVSAGVISPDGTPMGPPPGQSTGLVTPSGEPVGSSNEIWTPDSETPSGESKSKLWTPD